MSRKRFYRILGLLYSFFAVLVSESIILSFIYMGNYRNNCLLKFCLFLVIFYMWDITLKGLKNSLIDE